MPLGREQVEHIKVIEFLRQCTDLPFLHIANERRTSAQAGALLKRMGVVSGIPDIFIPRATKKFHGVWIELKVGKNKLSSSQLDFINKMITEDYGAFVAYGSDECIEIIKKLYDIN